MKNITVIFTSFLLLPFYVFGQSKRDSAVTSIGWVIHVGDSIELTNGTMDNGDFKYVKVGIWHISNIYGNKKYKVSKIKTFKGTKLPYIITDKKMGMKATAYIEIESAIKAGEVVVPDSNNQKFNNK